MSTEQRQTLDAILRQSAFPADSDVDEQRRLLKELLSAQPLPADVTVTAAALGRRPDRPRSPSRGSNLATSFSTSTAACT